MSELFMECEEEELEPWQRRLQEIKTDDDEDVKPIFVGGIRISEVTPNTRPNLAPVIKVEDQRQIPPAATRSTTPFSGAGAPTTTPPPQRPPQATAGAPPVSRSSPGPIVPQVIVRATAQSATKSLLIPVASRPGSLPIVVQPASRALSTQSPQPIVINNHQGYMVKSPQINKNSTFIASLGNQYPPGTSFTVLPAGQQLLVQMTSAKSAPGVVHRPTCSIQNNILTMTNVQTKLQPIQMNAGTIQPGRVVPSAVQSRLVTPPKPQNSPGDTSKQPSPLLQVMSNAGASNVSDCTQNARPHMRLQAIMEKESQIETLSSLANETEELKRIVLENANCHGAPLKPWVGNSGQGSCQFDSFIDQINLRPEFADHPLRDPSRKTIYLRNDVVDMLTQCTEARAMSGLSNRAWSNLHPLRTSGVWASDSGDYVLPGLAHIFRVHILVYQTFYNKQLPTPIIVIPATVFGAEPFSPNPVVLGWNSSQYENFVCTSDESLRRTAELVEEWRNGTYTMSIHDIPSLHGKWEAEEKRRQNVCMEPDPARIERNRVLSVLPIPDMTCRGCNVPFKRVISHLQSKGGAACRLHYSDLEIIHHKVALTKARKKRYLEKKIDKVTDGHECRGCNRIFKRIVSHLHSGGGSVCRQHYSEQEISHHKAAKSKARKRRYVERNLDKVRDGNRVRYARRKELQPDKVRAENRASYYKRRALQPDKVRAQNRAAYIKRKTQQPDKVRAQNRAAYFRRKLRQREKVRAQNRSSRYRYKLILANRIAKYQASSLDVPLEHNINLHV